MSFESQPLNDPTTQAKLRREIVRGNLMQCLGCHWAVPAEPKPVTVGELSACSGHPDPTTILKRLRRSETIVATPVVLEAGPTNNVYTPANNEQGRAYVETLAKLSCRRGENSSQSRVEQGKNFVFPTTPTQATSPEAIAAANVDAEAFLIEHGIGYPEARETRRNMLGCVACKLNRSEPEARFTITDVSNCTARSRTAVKDTLFALETAQLIERQNTDDLPGKAKAAFILADNPDAAAFRELLAPPEVCPYEAGRQAALQQSQSQNLPEF